MAPICERIELGVIWYDDSNSDCNIASMPRSTSIFNPPTRANFAICQMTGMMRLSFDAIKIPAGEATRKKIRMSGHMFPYRSGRVVERTGRASTPIKRPASMLAW